MAKKYPLVMFDLDGTLLDTIGDIRHNINLAMAHFGYPSHTYEETRTFINDGAKKLIERALPKDKRSEEYINRTLEMYLHFYDINPSIETRAYDGITDLVARLKSEGYTLAVVSNKPERHVFLLCDMFFGKGTFSYMSGTGGDKPVKPSKECVDFALDKLGMSKDDLLYVGDSHVDVTTAHNSGVPCAGVTWGFHGKNGFKDKVPDFYVDNAKELYAVISGE